MDIGDTVRLKQPFKPQLASQKDYCFGIIVGLAVTQPDEQNPTENGKINGIIVHLYDPEIDEIYTDELGLQAIYLFQADEMESV